MAYGFYGPLIDVVIEEMDLPYHCGVCGVLSPDHTEEVQVEPMTIELPEGSMILDRIQAYARVRDIPFEDAVVELLRWGWSMFTAGWQAFPEDRDAERLRVLKSWEEGESA